MRKLVIGIVAVAMLALIAVPATAGVLDQEDIEITVTVEPYAEVTWGAGTALTLMGPGQREKDKNWFEIPITVKSNCSVQLDIAEGLSQWLYNQGIPWEGMWSSYFSGDYDELIYGPGVSILSTKDYPAPHTNPQGPCFAYSHKESTDAIPGGGQGLHAKLDLNYGAPSMGPDGPADLGAYIYEGTFQTYIAFMCDTHNGSYSGKDWTSLEAGTSGSFCLWATVSTQ